MLACFAAVAKWEIAVETVLRSNYDARKPVRENGGDQWEECNERPLSGDLAA
jgi:hypothetical protein